jgi:hypothetical protein
MTMRDDNESGAKPDHTILGTHPDDLAIDRFAAMMKEKMAKSRANGRSGWDDPQQVTIGELSCDLRIHTGKGDPVDVGLFAMMIALRGGHIIQCVPLPASHLDYDALMRQIDVHRALREERVAAEQRNVTRRAEVRENPGRRRADKKDE